MDERVADSFEQQLPSRLALYRQMVDLFKVHEPTYQKNYTETHSRAPDSTGFLPFDGVRQPILMPETGIDEVELGYIVTDKLDNRQKESIDNHDLLRICLFVFRDGSPYVMDGDVVEAIYEADHQYYLLLGPELLPCLVQAEQLDHDSYTAGSLKVVNKHFLSDTECANLFTYLTDQTDHIDYYPYNGKLLG